MSRARFASLVLGSVAALVAAPAAGAQSPDSVRIQQSGRTGVSQSVTVPVGKSVVIDLPTDVRDALIADPLVADLVVRTARRVSVIGVKEGQTNAFFTDATGRQILNLDIRVAQDTSSLDDLIRRFVPNARIQVHSINGGLVLAGSAPSLSDADRVVQLAGRFVDAPQKITNLISIEGQQQVMLKVRVVEMQRSLIKQLGVNVNASNILNRFVGQDDFFNIATSFGYSIAGSALGGLAANGGEAATRAVPASVSYPDGSNLGALSPLGVGVGGFNTELVADPGTGETVVDTTFGPATLQTDSRSDVSIQALERVGLLRTLAEPSITAISGESAKFLAGGEYPVPVSQDQDGAISIEFKEYGVGLGFSPVVLSDGRIALAISTEVSDLTNEGAVRTGDRPILDADGNVVDVIRGLSIPALTVSRVETHVELPSGGSIVLAGLIRDSARQALEGLPGAKDMPVLGALFRSRDFQRRETELVVIVTPYLVKPVSAGALSEPGAGFRPANEAAAAFLGKLNQVYRTAGDPAKGGIRGPFGFIVE
jgi:pilus assembly protein CpaC